MARVGFYGGSFNPVHYGHMMAMLLALEVAELDLLCVAPVFKHPDGKVLAPFEDRIRMLELACGRHLQDDVVVSRAEEGAYQVTGTGYTADTLRYLLDKSDAEGFGEDVLVLIMGSDLKANFPYWEGHDRIQDMVKLGRVEILWLDRTGNFSSTLVRMKVKHGLHTKRMVPRRVMEFIREKGLYL